MFSALIASLERLRHFPLLWLHSLIASGIYFNPVSLAVKAEMVTIEPSPPALPYNPHVLWSTHEEVHRLRQHLHLPPAVSPISANITSPLASQCLLSVYPPSPISASNIHPSHPLAITLPPPTPTPSLAFSRSLQRLYLYQSSP
jgi:hypothetical protein